MKLHGFVDIELFFKCFCLWIFLYSTIIALIEVSIYYVLIPIAAHFIVLHISLKPPSQESINDVFGENPRSQFRNFNFEFPLKTNHLPIAHKAAGFDFEENSVNAVKQCINNGCKFIHLDINVTADDVAVIGSKLSLSIDDGHHQIKKSIEECSLEELSLGSLSGAKEQKFSTLQEVLTVVENYDVKIMLNVMHSMYYKSSDSVVQTILKVFQRNQNLYRKSVVSSTNAFFLHKLRKRDPSIVVAIQWVGYSEEPISTISWLKTLHYNNRIQSLMIDLVDVFSWWFFNNFTCRLIGVSSVILPKHMITPNVVENWERKNVRCIAAVVNLSSEKTYYANALGIAYLTDTLMNNEIQSK